MALRGVWTFLSDVVTEWQRDKALMQGAALAYYALFSLAPMLVLIIIVAGLVLGRAAAQGEIVGQIEGFIGADAASTVQEMVERASRPTAGILPTIASLAAMMFGASGLVVQLRTTLNHIWGVTPAAGGVRGVVRDRLLALALIGGMGLLLLLSVVVSAVVTATQELIAGQLPVLARVVPFANLGLSLAVSATFFAMIFRFLPDVRLGWRDVALGALVTTILFAIGKSLIALYLGRAGAGSVYGAAGSLVLLLLWVYYSAQILLVGAEVTAVWSRRHGSLRAAARPDP